MEDSREHPPLTSVLSPQGRGAKTVAALSGVTIAMLLQERLLGHDALDRPKRAMSGYFEKPA